MPAQTVQSKGFLDEFLKTDIIDGSTINHVAPPVLGGVEMPYIALAVAALAFAAFFIYLKGPEKKARRAFIYASVFTGLLFAARMDFKWLMTMVRDVPAFAGK